MFGFQLWAQAPGRRSVVSDHDGGHPPILGQRSSYVGGRNAEQRERMPRREGVRAWNGAKGGAAVIRHPVHGGTHGVALRLGAVERVIRPHGAAHEANSPEEGSIVFQKRDAVSGCQFLGASPFLDQHSPMERAVAKDGDDGRRTGESSAKVGESPLHTFASVAGHDDGLGPFGKPGDAPRIEVEMQVRHDLDSERTRNLERPVDACWNLVVAEQATHGVAR